MKPNHLPRAQTHHVFIPVVGVPRDLVHGDVLAVGDDGGLEELGHVDDDGEEEDGEDEHQQAAAGRVLASQGLSQNRICVNNEGFFT